MANLLPVLVADLTEESARDFLVEVARENEEAWVPLVAAPTDASEHLLEVFTPGSTEPLRLLALPTGPPTEHGFPLRLSILDGADHESLGVPTVEHVEVGLDVTIEPALVAGNDPLIGRSIAGGKLIIESLVGAGMMGSVYKAIHRELRMHVAVKVLHESYQRDADFCQRFYAEALAASRLDHPNLVRVYDFGQEPDGLLYLSMELVAGRSVREVLSEEGPMSGERAADIMMQVCAGLGQAHASGIVHRDVKPDNVVLVMRQDDDGQPVEHVKVCDFGLALLRASDSTSERFAGTPVYMSPEQCRGEELDSRTDVYACGIMLYELATGTVPFLSDKPIVVINRHLTMPPPRLEEHRPDVDRRLEPIVQQALKKSRDERYASVRALRADLRALLSAPSASPSPVPVSVRGAQASRPAQQAAQRTARAAVGASAPPEPMRASAPPTVAVKERSPAVSASSPPAWFEDAQDSYSQFLTGMTTEKPLADISGALARDPKTWLRSLLEEREPRAVARMLTQVEAAVHVLARAADARTLRAVSSTIHSIATDEARQPAVRQRALLVMKVFADPSLLAPIAQRLLTHADESRHVCRTLLLQAELAGAYAIYGARVKLAAVPAAREPFVDTLRAFGEVAWPVVRAALERIPAAALTGGHPLGAELAEDLLSCVPTLRDEAAGHLVAKYVRATTPALSRAATQALGRLWAERAAPLLLALLDAEDDGLRIAAIAGLREIGAVDEHVVRRLVPILERKAEAGHELYLATVAALEFVTPGARPVAVPLLARLVRSTALDDDAVHAAAKALLSVMGNEARSVVIDRSDLAPPELKERLLVLLRDPTLPEVDANDLKDLL